MGYLVLKTVVTAVVIVAASELSKRSTWAASLLASAPLTSILIFVWMHVEGSGNQRIAEMSQDIFWLVIPSLAFFLLLPVLLKKGFSFPLAMALSLGVTTLLYASGVKLRFFA